MDRSSGILLHPTSLPGRFGIGDLGKSALHFLDWLEAAGQAHWQVLPLGPTGYGNSPYGTLSAFAGNPLLISPERLVEEGLLEPEALDEVPDVAVDRVDYDRVREWKRSVLRRSWESTVARGPVDLLDELEGFASAPEQASWLEDWCLYAALAEDNRGAAWVDWPQEIRLRDSKALERARNRLEHEIAFERFQQFLFWRQWKALKSEANQRGIQIFGDIPIYVALDSAEVWAHQELFELDEEGNPVKVSGVPPDYFSATGQRWGNPIYRWDRLAASGYRWWIDRLRNELRRVDLIRLDHFRGFAGYWEIEAEQETAVNGEWVEGPGLKLFAALTKALGDLPLVAEDLGVITPDVVELRRDLRLPGMKVLQFGFFEIDSDHLPHNVAEDTVYYTGTHDNDTIVGWYGGLDEAERSRVHDYLGAGGGSIQWDLIRAVLSSRARLSILTAQDAAGLDSSARMNTPGVGDGNWEWRLRDGQLDESLATWLKRLSLLTGRVKSEPEEGRDEESRSAVEAEEGEGSA